MKYEDIVIGKDYKINNRLLISNPRLSKFTDEQIVNVFSKQYLFMNGKDYESIFTQTSPSIGNFAPRLLFYVLVDNLDEIDNSGEATLTHNCTCDIMTLMRAGCTCGGI